MANDRIRLFRFCRTPRSGHRRRALQCRHSGNISNTRRLQAVPVWIRTKLSRRRAEVFLGQPLMLQLNPSSDQLNRLSGYHAAQLITKEWMQPIDAPHEIFPVGVTQAKGSPSSAVSVYAVRRPDKQWGLLAINKDPMRTARLSLQFNFSGTRQQATFVGSVDVIRFSRDQYEWHEDGPNGHPIRSLPPA